MSYSYFAKVYDLLTDNAEYAKAAERYVALAARYGKGSGRAVDLGCGTGSLSVELCRLGYDVIGVDISPDMLSHAYNKAADKKLPIQFVCQDMTELELGGKVDVIFSYLDCIDHLPSMSEVKRTFERCAMHLDEGGLFIFDVNTVYKHREILSDNVFVFEREGLFCIWQNFYNEENDSVDILLDFFEETDDGRYERYSEEFTERAYILGDISRRLEEAGFEVLGVYDEMTDAPASENSERAVFCARKTWGKYGEQKD